MLTLRRALAPFTVLLLLTACSRSGEPPTVAAPGPTTVGPSAGLGATPTPTPPTASPDRGDDPLSPRPAVESAAPPLGQGTCRPEQLRVDDADGVDDAGRVLEVFVVRTTQQACQLGGFPNLAFVDAGGRALPTRLERDGAAAPVTLSPTSTASFRVAWRRDPSCPQATAALVTLPGTSKPLRAVTSIRVCARIGLEPLARLVEDEGTAD